MDLLMPEFGLFFWTLIAFIAVFLILKKFAWKPILKSLTERETGIAESIAAADRVKAEMGQMQAENEKLMAQAREERTQMMKDARGLFGPVAADPVRGALDGGEQLHGPVVARADGDDF